MGKEKYRGNEDKSFRLYFPNRITPGNNQSFQYPRALMHVAIPANHD